MGSLASGWIIRMGGRFVTEYRSRIGDASDRRVHTPGVNSLRQVVREGPWLRHGNSPW